MGKNEEAISKENVLEALKVLDQIEEAVAKDENYDLLPDAKRLNKLIPGQVYGKATDHIRYICNELLASFDAAGA